MSSTSTTWSTQGNTKAGATVTSTDSLTTGTLTADTLQLASNIIKASDGDTAITLDTSSNALIAGGLTSTTLLTATAGIKLGNNIIYASDGGSTITLDTNDNVTILGDLTVTGGKLTFGNAEFISNESDGFTYIGSLDSVNHGLVLSAINGYDSYIAFNSHVTHWSIGYDASDTTDNPLLFNQGTGLLGANTMMKLASDGDLTIAGDLTVDGGDVTVNNMTSSGFIKCVGNEGASAAVELWADEGDDDADKWQISSSINGKLQFMTYASGSWVSNLEVTSHASDASSSVTVAGDLYVGGDVINLTTTTSYGVSSFSTNRTIAGSTSAADTTDVLATLITDLINIGIIDAA